MVGKEKMIRPVGGSQIQLKQRKNKQNKSKIISAGNVRSRETSKNLAHAQQNKDADSSSTLKSLAEMEIEKKLAEKNFENEKQVRSQLEAERDKMQQFWEITKQQLDIQKQECWRTQQAAENARSSHLQEVLDLHQKIRLLMMKSGKTTVQKTGSEADINKTVKFDSESPQKKASMLIQHPMATQTDPETQIITTKQPQKTQIERLSQEYSMIQERDREIHRLETEMEQYQEKLRSELNAMHKHEIEHLKQQKQKQFDEILGRHQKDLAELQEDFDQQLSQERELNDAMKVKLETAESEFLRISESQAETQEKYEKMFDLYKTSEIKNADAQRQVEDMEKERQGFEPLKRETKMTKKKLQDLEKKYEILWTDFKKLEKERDSLQKEFRASIRLIQDQAELKNATLLRQLSQAEKLLQNLSSK